MSILEGLTGTGREARYFWAGPAMWSPAVLAIGGWLIFALLVWLVLEILESSPAIICVVVGGLAVWPWHHLLARIRVDGCGVAQRRRWGWDLWPWEDFVTGQATAAERKYLYWRWSSDREVEAALDLAVLDRPDADAVQRLINTVLGIRAEETLASRHERLTLSLDNGDTVVLSESGMLYESEDDESKAVWEWTDVLLVEVWRSEVDPEEFVELQIRLTDQTVLSLRHGPYPYRKRSWCGATAQQLVAYVSDHLAADRVVEYRVDGEPSSLEEVNKRAARQEAEWHWERYWRRFRVVFGVMGCTFLCLIWPAQRTHALIVLGVEAAYLLHVIRLRSETMRHERAKYAALRARFSR